GPKTQDPRPKTQDPRPKTTIILPREMRSILWGLYQLAAGAALVVAGPFLLLRRVGHYLPTLPRRLRRRGRRRGNPGPCPAADDAPAGDHRHSHRPGAGAGRFRRPRGGGLPPFRPRLCRAAVLPPPRAARPGAGRRGLLASAAARGPAPRPPHRRRQRPGG